MPILTSKLCIYFYYPDSKIQATSDDFKSYTLIWSSNESSDVMKT